LGAIPFTIYDFLAYLSTGALLLLGADYAFDLKWVLGQAQDTGHTVVWVIVAYVLGHINSHAAAFVFEENLVERWLRYPSVNLLTTTEHFGGVAGFLFHHYVNPLPQETAKAILDRYEKLSGSRVAGDAMFDYCFAHVKERSKVSYERLQTFLAIYGFSRNMSLAALVLAGIFVAAAITRGTSHFWLLAGANLVAGAVLFWRYLKFFRLFTFELYTCLLGLRD
jgi:hypothetical protein